MTQNPTGYIIETSLTCLETNMISSLSEFIDLCVELGRDNDKIFDLWNDGITDELRVTIQNFADPRSPEPIRSAMYNIGFTKF